MNTNEAESNDVRNVGAASHHPTNCARPSVGAFRRVADISLRLGTEAIVTENLQTAIRLVSDPANDDFFVDKPKFLETVGARADQPIIGSTTSPDKAVLIHERFMDQHADECVPA